MRPSLPIRALAMVLLVTPGIAQIATTPADFAQPGTQPGDLTAPVLSYMGCTFCHSDFDEAQEPFERWSGSMMANSMRDPVFQAALTIANQDLKDTGTLCIRCHAPAGWLGGRSLPANGS